MGGEPSLTTLSRTGFIQVSDSSLSSTTLVARIVPSRFVLGGRFRQMRWSKMSRFYAELVGRLAQRGAALYRIQFLEQTRAAT
jgi:hypothetical protein